MNLELMAYLTDHNRLWAIDESYLLRFKASAEAYTGGAIEARDNGAPSRTANNIAVIDISGPISPRPSIFSAMFGGTAISSVRASLRQALADDTVRAIVLAFSTPGGEVEGVSDLATEIQAARVQKTIVSHISGLGASAGFWLASSGQRITATKDSLVGSVGVLALHADISVAMEQEGVKVTTISAGRYKAEGSPYEPLSDAAREHVQGLVDAAYGDFVGDVAKSRGVATSQVRKGYGEGRVLTASAAKDAGMIDSIGTLESVVAKLMPRLGVGARAEGKLGYMMAESDPARILANVERKLQAVGRIDSCGRDDQAAWVIPENLDEALAPLLDPKSRESIDAQQEQARVWDLDQDRARRLRVT